MVTLVLVVCSAPCQTKENTERETLLVAPSPPPDKLCSPSFAQRESKLERTSKLSSETSSKNSRATKRKSDDGSSDSEDPDSDPDSDSSEADGGLVLVHKKSSGDGKGGGDGTGPEEDAAFAELLQKGKKKEKKMRITSDGVAAAGVAKKKVFNDDGAAEVRVLPVRFAVLACFVAAHYLLNLCLVSLLCRVVVA